MAVKPKPAFPARQMLVLGTSRPYLMLAFDIRQTYLMSFKPRRNSSANGTQPSVGYVSP